jgi:hypothetical protein
MLPGPKEHIRGGGGIIDNQWECDLDEHAVATRENLMKGLPLVVAGHPSFLPLHMGWLTLFSVLSPRTCGTLTNISDAGLRAYRIASF